MDIYQCDVNKKRKKYWRLNPPESWTLGKNNDRIKYSTSECKAKIGDCVIFYQTKQEEEKIEGRVQHVGEVYKIADEYNGEEYDDRYVYFEITAISRQPISLAEIQTNFEALQNYPPQGGVSQMKDDKFEAGKRLIEFIKNKSQSEK